MFKRELIKECLKVSTDSVCLLNVVGMQVKTVGTVCVRQRLMGLLTTFLKLSTTDYHSKR